MFDEDVAQEVCLAMASLQSLLDHDLCSTTHAQKDATKDHAAIPRAYELSAPLAFIGTPRLFPYYIEK